MNASGSLAFVWRTSRVVSSMYDGVSLHCLLCLLHYNVVSLLLLQLCRGFTEFVGRVRTDTGCTGCRRVERKERFNSCEEHTHWIRQAKHTHASNPDTKEKKQETKKDHK